MADFTPGHGPIVVDVEVSGPMTSAVVRMVLDTGATATLLTPGVVLALGYDPDAASDHVSVTTVEGVRRAPRVHLNRLTALGRHRLGFPVVCHALPTGSGIQGLLGLDFFADSVLKIDFRRGHIELV